MPAGPKAAAQTETWTVERDTMLRELWANLTVPTKEMHRRLSALPGRIIRNHDIVRWRAAQLGLPSSRTEAARGIGASTWHSGANLLTPEREAVFRRLYPDTSLRVTDVVAAMNALPGEPYSIDGANHVVKRLAERLGLPPRRRGARLGPRLPKEVQAKDEAEATGFLREDPQRWTVAALVDYYGWPVKRAQRFRRKVLMGGTALADATGSRAPTGLGREA